MRIVYIFCCFLLFTNTTFSQIVVSGNVLDKSKLNYVEGVRVFTTAGKITISDSLGRYSINANKGDSIFFVYNTKPTQKFSINSIPNHNQFDISLSINIKSKYTVLKEVIVYSKNYHLDSAENRNTYAKIFNHHNPRLEPTFNPGGAAGFDANELFNLFRPKYNRRMQKLQEMMIRNEEEQYVNFRFNKNFVRRVTQITGPALDTFMTKYRPNYFFTSTSSDIQFNQFILNASYQFRRLRGEVTPPSFIEGGETPMPNKNLGVNKLEMLESPKE